MGCSEATRQRGSEAARQQGNEASRQKATGGEAGWPWRLVQSPDGDDCGVIPREARLTEPWHTAHGTRLAAEG